MCIVVHVRSLWFSHVDLCPGHSRAFFEDLRVPNSALLGKENHGFYYLMDQLPQERVGPDSNLL